jgi:hypothetical protein
MPVTNENSGEECGSEKSASIMAIILVLGLVIDSLALFSMLDLPWKVEHRVRRLHRGTQKPWSVAPLSLVPFTRSSHPDSEPVEW